MPSFLSILRLTSHIYINFLLTMQDNFPNISGSQIHAVPAINISTTFWALLANVAALSHEEKPAS
jgi:hypothetical protein